MRKKNSLWTIKKLTDSRHVIEFPEYQREPTVWNLEKKQRLIDSILRDFDIAPVYFFRKEDETYGVTYDCIDGRQRINAIFSYLGVNKDQGEDNEFHLTIVNEIYDDTGSIRVAHEKRFASLTPELQTRIHDYQINVIEIDEVENEEELNLLFLRLQLGQILNPGEKLHAMTGAMRDYIFNDIGRHEFFKSVRIPYRRYAREQVAAQITLNYISRKEEAAFHRARYIDLQEFFKERNKLDRGSEELRDEVKQKLDEICNYLKGELPLITKRALAVSLFLFVSELIDQGREGEMADFAAFLVKFLKTLKWQIPKGVQMDSEYVHLLDFQNYVSQATGEKYAIQNRHDYLGKAFYYFQKYKIFEGDNEYLNRTGDNADEQRGTTSL